MFFTSLTTPHFIFFFFFNDTATTEIYTFPYTTLFRNSGGGDSPLPAFGTRGRRKRAAAGSTTAHNGKFRCADSSRTGARQIRNDRSEAPPLRSNCSGAIGPARRLPARYPNAGLQIETAFVFLGQIAKDR